MKGTHRPSQCLRRSSQPQRPASSGPHTRIPMHRCDCLPMRGRRDLARPCPTPQRRCALQGSGGRTGLRNRTMVHAGEGISIDDLDLDIPEVADDLAAFQEKMGAVFNDDGVATSYGDENDWKSAEAWQYGVVMVDRSHWGRIRVAGDGRTEFLHAQSTNDVASMKPGEAKQTVFVTSTGRTLDLALVLAQGQGCMVIVSPGMADTLLERLNKYIFPMDRVQLSNISSQTKMFTVMGPEAHMLVREWGGDELVDMPRESHVVKAFNGSPVIVVASSGMGAAVEGWTFILQDTMAAEFWRKAALKGALPMGSDIWENVRILNGVPKVGSELTEDFNPLEAGLYHAVSLTKGCYIGQETLSKIYNTNGVKQQLWGLRLRQGATCSVGDEVLDQDGKKRGRVTSVAKADDSFALAYLKCKERGEQVALEGRQVMVAGEPAKVTAIAHAVRSLAEEPTRQTKSKVLSAEEEAAKEAKLKAMQERLAAFQAGHKAQD